MSSASWKKACKGVDGHMLKLPQELINMGEDIIWSYVHTLGLLEFSLRLTLYFSCPSPRTGHFSFMRERYLEAIWGRGVLVFAGMSLLPGPLSRWPMWYMQIYYYMHIHISIFISVSVCIFIKVNTSSHWDRWFKSVTTRFILDFLFCFFVTLSDSEKPGVVGWTVSPQKFICWNPNPKTSDWNHIWRWDL